MVVRDTVLMRATSQTLTSFPQTWQVKQLSLQTIDIFCWTWFSHVAILTAGVYIQEKSFLGVIKNWFFTAKQLECWFLSPDECKSSLTDNHPECSCAFRVMMMDMMGNMTNRVMRPMTMATATSPKGMYSLLLSGVLNSELVFKTYANVSTVKVTCVQYTHTRIYLWGCQIFLLQWKQGFSIASI